MSEMEAMGANPAVPSSSTDGRSSTKASQKNNNKSNSKKGDDHKKRPKKKKKHISKHVLKAKSDAATRSTENPATTIAPSKTEAASSSSSPPSSSIDATVKDPSEAATYLTTWKAKQGWKFNKNTQSWLLRHMYDSEKVSKNTFTLLLEYMKGLQGKDAKKRVLEEATSRAQRYRDYEKATQQQEQQGQEHQSNKTSTTAKSKESLAAEVVAEKVTDDKESLGWEQWKTLDDHDKRKEYKRARKVLETITATDP